MPRSNDDERRPLLPDGGYNLPGPAKRKLSIQNRTVVACLAILVTVILERIAFYGLLGNLVMFLTLTPLDWMSYNAIFTLFLFTGLSYMTAIFGGWIADSCLGKFKTIVLFFIIYIGGYACMPLLHPFPDDNDSTSIPNWCRMPKNLSGNNTLESTEKSVTWEPMVDPLPRSPSDETCAWLVYLAIAIIAIGNGSIKVNIAPFGADQVRMQGPTATRVFFNWFYWSINIGALVALGVIAYVQQEVSFFWGYVAPNITLVVSMVVFISGVCVYVMKRPSGSVLSNITRILLEACRLSCKQKRSHTETSSPSSTDIDTLSDPPQGCLDRAKVRFGGSFHDSSVDDVRSLGKVVMVFLSMVPYWIVYFQMETTFVIQGLHMKLDFDNNDTHKASDATNFKLPAAWLSVFDILFLVILIPLFDRVIYPALDKRGHHLSLRGRIIIGMVFGVAAVTCAGGLEMKRLSVYWQNGTEHTHWQRIGSTYYMAANMSILYQIPQYALIGISEVFASVAGLELAYIHSPRSMQGIIMGLFWFTQGLGSMLGSTFLYAFRGIWFFNWDNGDINCHVKCPKDKDDICKCHLDYYFFFLAGVQVLGILAFICVSWVFDIGQGSPKRHRNKNGYVTVTASNPRDNSPSPDNESVQIRRNGPLRTPRDSQSSADTDASDGR